MVLLDLILSNHQISLISLICVFLKYSLDPLVLFDNFNFFVQPLIQKEVSVFEINQAHTFCKNAALILYFNQMKV
jgi:hypothetical protein